MGFFSKGMQIGLAEGFMDQQAESRDRQERLTEDYRKEMKAAQIRARKVLDEQEQDDQINLNITKNILSSTKLNPELVKQLEGLDTETKIELGQSLRSTLRVMGEKPLTYDRLAIQVKKQIGQVLANDERIRKAKAERASQPGTTEEQTESILSAFSPKARGQADRARIDRGVSPEAREVMDSGFARRTRKGLQDIRFEAEDLIGTGERAKIEDNLSKTISGDRNERFKVQKIMIIGSILFDDKNPPTRGAANRILQDFKEIEQAGVEFNSKNSQKIAEDIRERGSEVVFNELKQGTHELSPPKKDAPKETISPSPKEDTSKETIKKDAPSPKETIKKDAPSPKETILQQVANNIGDKVDVKKLRKIEGERKRGDFYIRTYVNDATGKVYKVTINKAFKVVDVDPQ